MPRVVALWGKNSFTAASCGLPRRASTGDPLEPVDQPLARRQHLGLPAGEQVALEVVAGPPEALADRRPVVAERRPPLAEAGLAQQKPFVGDQRGGPATRARRRFDRRQKPI